MFEFISNFQSPVPLLNITSTIWVPFVLMIAVGLVTYVKSKILYRVEKKNLKIIIFACFFPFAALFFVFYPYIIQFFAYVFQINVSTTPISAFSVFKNIGAVLTTLLVYVILVVPMAAIRLFTAKNKKFSKISVRFIGPVMEEVIYRYVLLGVLLAFNIEVLAAIPFVSLIFALAPNHTMSKNKNGWTGFYRPYYVIIYGFVFAFCALQYGLIASMLIHILNNNLPF